MLRFSFLRGHLLLILIGALGFMALAFTFLDPNENRDSNKRPKKAGIPISIEQGDISGLVPITVGMPIPAGTFTTNRFTVSGNEEFIPTQTQILFQSGDPTGQRWLFLDFLAELPVTEAYSLHEREPPAPDTPVLIENGPEGTLMVDTGAGVWTITPDTNLLAAVTGPDGTPLINGAGWGGEAVAASVEIVDAGPIRAMVRLRAEHAVQGLDLVARLHFYGGLPYARVRLTLINHNEAVMGIEAPTADNGECGVEETQPVMNGLSSPNRIVAEDITWALELPESTSSERVLYQDSSGTDNWDYYVGSEPRMQSGVRRRGYVYTVDGVETETGDAASGTLAAGGVRLDVPWFRELFPKALRARGNRLELGLFPGEFAAGHVLRVGEQKTVDVLIGLDETNDPPSMLYASPGFEHLRETHALGFIGPRVPGQFNDYEEYLDAQLDDNLYDIEECEHNLFADGCATSIFDARQRWDFYGWLDYGDIPTDFETPTNPYNLKYDTNLGFLQQALRTGNTGWWSLAHAANIHFADIDLFHSPVRGYSVDRVWWQGGAWGHSFHDEAGLTNPHRNCGNPGNDTYWGGTGMAAWALLTGDDMVRESTLEFADNALWRIRNSVETPCAIAAWGGGNGEGYTMTNPPSRAVANTQRLLVWAFRLTGDSAYLETAGEAAAWYECERDGGHIALTDCASWQEALLARSMGEYITVARDAGIPLHALAETALRHLLESLGDNLGRDGEDRAWLRTCEAYNNTAIRFDEINAWMFLAADAFAYGWAVFQEQDWLDNFAAPSFNTAAEDPWYEGDSSQYHSSKELANTVPNGLVYLHFAQGDQPFSVSLPDVNAVPGLSFSLPVTVGDTTGRGILGFQFDLLLDPELGELTGLQTDGTLTQGWQTNLENISSGQWRIVATAGDATTLSGSGTLITLEGRAGTATGQTDLVLSDFQSGDITAQTSNGVLTLAFPVADRWLPHVTRTRGGFQTTFTFLNTAARNTMIYLWPYTEAGDLLEPLEVTLGPGVYRSQTRDDLFPGLDVSHCAVTGDDEVVVLAGYRHVSETGGSAHAQENRLNRTRFTLFQGEWEHVWDGMALVNLGEEPALIEGLRYDSAGNEIFRETIELALAPNAKHLLVFSTFFPDLPGQSIVIRSSQPATLLFLRGSNDSRFLYQTIPITTE